MVTQPHGAKPDGEDPRRAENARLLGELLASHGTELRRQAEYHSRLAADAEDALHDAYALFLERYHGRWPALPYLLTTIKRSAWAIARSAERTRERSVHGTVKPESRLDPLELIPDFDSDPETQAERDEQTERRRAAILALKPDERRALLLVAAGLSYEEIAELNRWSRTKVNRCIAEGRAALRKRLAD
jgi:RNA polymerase sigma factor (sigma-70 family)